MKQSKLILLISLISLAAFWLTATPARAQGANPASSSLDGAAYQVRYSGGTVDPPSTMTHTYTVAGNKIYEDDIWEDRNRIIDTQHHSYVIEGNHFFIESSDVSGCQKFYGANTCGFVGTITPKVITFITVADGRNVTHLSGIGTPYQAKRIKTRRQ
jgi:hypothetical protein